MASGHDFFGRSIGSCSLEHKSSAVGPPLGPMSELGPGCVKTRLGKGCAELFSQLLPSERSCQHNRLPHRRNRDGSSTRKLEIGVFTQSGSKADIPRCAPLVRSTPNSGHPRMRLECPLSADFVAKVENRTARKISPKLIFGLLRCRVAFQHRYGGP